MKKTIILIILFCLLATSFFPFITVGENIDDTNNFGNSLCISDERSDNTGVTIYKNGCIEGYTFLNIRDKVEGGLYTSLIDMDGVQVNSWQIDSIPAKMLPGGKIIGGDFSREGYYNRCKNITEINWDGEVLWSFSRWDNDSGEYHCRMHHDFQREGNPVGYYAPGQNFVDNGTTLILAYKDKFIPKITNKKIFDDVIYEVDWNGNLTGFEWHASDYFDQFGFSLIEKIGIYLNPGSGLTRVGDILHINSVSEIGKNKWYDSGDERFHPKNLIIDSRHGNFIVIINRTTGDIVWKVGPDFGTRRPSKNGKLGQLIGMHNAHIIPEGLPGAGNILVFDNGGAAGYGLLGLPNKYRLWSRVVEFNPVTLEIVWEYSALNFLSLFLSSAQRLPNGNTFITEGQGGYRGRVFEVNPDKEIVWEYYLPFKIYLYRAYRIPPEWIPGNPNGYPFWED
jgi:hypothetical protein